MSVIDCNSVEVGDTIKYVIGLSIGREEHGKFKVHEIVGKTFYSKYNSAVFDTDVTEIIKKSK